MIILTNQLDGYEIYQYLMTFRNLNIVMNTLCYENDNCKFIRFFFYNKLKISLDLENKLRCI